MRYMLVNVCQDSLQVNLHDPERSHRNQSLNRPGPSVALCVPRGGSVDLLKHFTSLESAYAHMRHSKDALHMLTVGHMKEYVCNDDGEQLDLEMLMGKMPKKAEEVHNVMVLPTPLLPMPQEEVPEALKDHPAFAVETVEAKSDEPVEEVVHKTKKKK